MNTPNRDGADWRPALLWLSALAFASTVIGVFTMRATDLRGDEYTYIAGAKAIAGALRGQTSFEHALDTVIGTGWFMPGIEFAATPLFLFTAHPPLWAIRVWFAGLAFATLTALTVSFYRRLGASAAAMLMTACGLCAGWQVLSMTALADVIAGLVACAALLTGYAIAMDIVTGARLRWSRLACLELLLIAAFFLRGPLILFPLAIHGVLLSLALAQKPETPETRSRTCLTLLLGLTACLAALVPWSLTASRYFHAPVVTTTNFPLVFADSFGDPQRTCFGPCPAGPDIWPAWHYAQDRARKTGTNPLVVQKRMMHASIAALTVPDYLRKVRVHFGNFLLDPAGMARSYAAVAYAVPQRLRPSWLKAILALTWVVYAPFLVALLAMNVIVFRASDAVRIQSLLLKAATACLFLEPFFHKSNARYWSTSAPFAAWAAALLVQRLQVSFRSSRKGDCRQGSPPPALSRLPRFFDRIQTAWACLFAAVAITLIVL